MYGTDFLQFFFVCTYTPQYIHTSKTGYSKCTISAKKWHWFFEFFFVCTYTPQYIFFLYVHTHLSTYTPQRLGAFAPLDRSRMLHCSILRERERERERMYVCTYIDTYIHTHTHTHMRSRKLLFHPVMIYTYTHTHTYTYTYTDRHTHTHTHTQIHTHKYIHIYTHIYTHQCHIPPGNGPRASVQGKQN